MKFLKMKLKKETFHNLRLEYSTFLKKEIFKNEKILVLHSDSAEPFRLTGIKSKKIFNLGISEQNMVTTAAGLSSLGYKPWINCFAQFMSTRCLDQIRNSILYTNYNVKMFGCHYGLDVAEDGATHQCIEDIGIFNSIPNIAIFSPADKFELLEILKFLKKFERPAYIRLPKSNVIEINKKSYKFKFGRLNYIYKNYKNKTAVIGTGNIFEEIFNAKNYLNTINKDFDVISLPCIKPLNYKNIIASLRKYKIIYTYEDHNIKSGIGSILKNILINEKIKIHSIGVRDEFAESGEKKSIYRKYNLDSRTLIKLIKKT